MNCPTSFTSQTTTQTPPLGITPRAIAVLVVHIVNHLEKPPADLRLVPAHFLLVRLLPQCYSRHLTGPPRDSDPRGLTPFGQAGRTGTANTRQGEYVHLDEPRAGCIDQRKERRLTLLAS